MFNLKRLLPHLILAPLVLFLFLSNTARFDSDQEIKGDAYGYMMMAYNLAHYGVLSKACEDFSKPCPPELREPTYYREPVMPAVFAGLISIIPGVAALDRSNFFTSPGYLQPSVARLVRQMSWAFVFITALCGLLITFLVSGSWSLSYLSFYLIGTSPVMSHYTQFFLTENMASMLFGITAIFLVYGLKFESRTSILLSGVSLGILALTRAVFSYLWPAYLLVLGIMWLKRREARKEALVFITLFLMGFFATTTVWKTRNYIVFNDFKISQRGGRALTIRTFFNQMSMQELGASFLLWSPYKPAKVALRNHFPPEATQRFDRSNASGFYRLARAHGAKKIEQMGSIEGDTYLKKEAIGTILSAPIKHILVSVSFGVRGMFTEYAKEFGNSYSIQKFWVNVILFGAFFIVCASALCTGNYLLLAVLLPALCSFCFHACFSNSRTRYNQPIILALWLSLPFLTYYIRSYLSRLPVWRTQRLLERESSQLNSVVTA